ncbi:MAG: right-handed parallel beta-helix repeat-containing protein, partial [Saprospiraceae bacterium]|nr:right-handed parallel beta-helix repeat-containing protein [Saprospiraceae bacterium]
MSKYYVTLEGNDQNSGVSLKDAFSTIARAADVAKAGDTIYVAGGSYRPSSVINISCCGEKTAPITFMPYENEKPVLDFSDITGLDTHDYCIVFMPGTQFVIFDGFEVKNSCGAALQAVNCSDITIRNCKVHDIQEFAISIRSDNCIVENNEVYNIAMAWEGCNSVNGGWPQVVNTYYKPPMGSATVGSYAYNNVFRGNYIHDCWSEGIDPIFSNGVLIENNIITNVFSVGIYLDSTINATIRNNYISTTNDVRNRTDANAPHSGIGMGCEYFGCWSDSPPMAHVENIHIYNNVISRVGTGIMWWYDDKNTDLRNGYENIKIHNNIISTKDGEYAALNFATDTLLKSKGNECKNNTIRASKSIVFDGQWSFENNCWVNGVPDNCKQTNDMSHGMSSIEQPIWEKQEIPTFEVGLNVIKNPGFEYENQAPKETPYGWTTIGDPYACCVVTPGFGWEGRQNKENKEEHSMKLGDVGAEFSVHTFQVAKDIPNGRYGLRARVKTFNENGKYHMEAKDFGGNPILCNIFKPSELANTIYDYNEAWFQLNMSDIMVTNGQCTVGFYGEGNAQDYVLIDE